MHIYKFFSRLPGLQFQYKGFLVLQVSLISSALFDTSFSFHEICCFQGQHHQLLYSFASVKLRQEIGKTCLNRLGCAILGCNPLLVQKLHFKVILNIFWCTSSYVYQDKFPLTPARLLWYKILFTEKAVNKNYDSMMCSMISKSVKSFL